jgi:2-dehydro-3-deoxyphosphooctonate aldolase (KDO 8-P synthase)
MKQNIVNIINGSYDSFFLLAGPCAVEDYDICAQVAEELISLTSQYRIPYIFKASYKKANRTSNLSFSSIGVDKALLILERIKNNFDIPIITDIHESVEVDIVKSVVDMIQIPAFLCRQTDLIVAAAATGLPVNIKKGQFMNSEGMRFAVEKVSSQNNPNCFLTERGNTFGYNDLVVDFTNIPAMNHFCKGVIMDCTHATQRPNQVHGITGGRPDFIHYLMRAGIAVGAKGLFVETHPKPSSALSDGANMLPLDQMSHFVSTAHFLSSQIRKLDA